MSTASWIILVLLFGAAMFGTGWLCDRFTLPDTGSHLKPRRAVPPLPPAEGAGPVSTPPTGSAPPPAAREAVAGADPSVREQLDAELSRLAEAESVPPLFAVRPDGVIHVDPDGHISPRKLMRVPVGLSVAETGQLPVSPDPVPDGEPISPARPYAGYPCCEHCEGDLDHLIHTTPCGDGCNGPARVPALALGPDGCEET